MIYLMCQGKGSRWRDEIHLGRAFEYPSNAINITASGSSPSWNLWSFGTGTRGLAAFEMAAGTKENPTAVLDGMPLGRFSWRGYDGATLATFGITRAQLEVRAVGDFVSGSNAGTKIVNSITPPNTTSMIDFHTIDNDGTNIPYGTYNISGTPHYHGPYGESVLGGTFNITGTGYNNVGLSVNLPASGTYDINYDVRAYMNFTITTAGRVYWINVELYDSTVGSAIANSERESVFYGVSNASYQGHAAFFKRISVSQPTTLSLYAQRATNDTVATWNISQINSDVNGRTILAYRKIR